MDDDLLREQRKTNRILLLAHGEAIERRVKTYLAHGPTRAILAILAEGETTTDALTTKAKAVDVARSSLYRIVGDLDRAGLVERPTRGSVRLSEFVSPFIAVSRPKAGSKDQGEEADPADDAGE